MHGNMMQIAVVDELGNQCELQNGGWNMQFAADSDQLFHTRD